MILNEMELEHHRFGPWLLEIKKSEDIPPQYGGIETNILSANYAFKVPIDKDRRDTMPGDLLYDMIVCINDHEIMVYTHKDKTQSVQQIPLTDIKYITITSDLLTNSIEVHSESHVISVPYNSISEAVANKAMELLRDKLFSQGSSLEKIKMPSVKETPSMLINNLLIGEQIYAPSMLLTYEPTTKILPLTATNWDKVTLLYNAYQVQESATLLNSKELIMITRIKQIKKRKTVDYGYVLNYIPLMNISKLDIVASSSYTNVMALKVYCGKDLVESFVTTQFDFKAFKDIIDQSK